MRIIIETIDQRGAVASGNGMTQALTPDSRRGDADEHAQDGFGELALDDSIAGLSEELSLADSGAGGGAGAGGVSFGDAGPDVLDMTGESQEFDPRGFGTVSMGDVHPTDMSSASGFQDGFGAVSFEG